MSLFLSLQWSLSSVRVGACFVSRRDVATHQSHITAALPHWSHILIIVHSSCACVTVQIAQAINVSDTFACLFLLFLLTLPLHEVTIPCFVLFSHFSILSHLFFFYFLFVFFVIFIFLTTASWNRSGWHPRSLTGQCTSHLPRPPLSPPDLHPSSCFTLLPSGAFLPLCAALLPPLCFPTPFYPFLSFFQSQNKPMFTPYANFSSHSVLFNHCLLISVSINCLLKPDLTAGGSPLVWLISCFVLHF